MWSHSKVVPVKYQVYALILGMEREVLTVICCTLIADAERCKPSDEFGVPVM